MGANKLPRPEALDEALRLGEKASVLDRTSNGYAMMSLAYAQMQNPEKALQTAEQAIAIAPNNAIAYDCMGAALTAQERFQDAIPIFEKSLRLSPIPHNAAVLLRLGASQRFVGLHEESITTFKRVLQLWPDNMLGCAYLTAAYSAAGQESEARKAASELLRIDPNFTSEGLIKRFSIRNKLLLDQMVADLRKAGLK